MSVDAVAPRFAAGLLQAWSRRIHAVHCTRWFWLLWCFIGAVSLFDAWLVLVNQSEMLDVEENVVCYLLIRLDPDGLSYFLPAKAAGTMLVLAILHGIFARLRRHGLVITGGVAMYQFQLLLYFLL